MSADRSLLMLRNSNLSKGAGLVHYITQPSIMCACRRNLWVLFCSTIGLWLESKLKFWTCWGEGRIVIHWRKITRKTRKKGTLSMPAYQSLLMHISNLSKGAGLGHYITQPSIMRACGRNLWVCPFCHDLLMLRRLTHFIRYFLYCPVTAYRTKWSGCRHYIIVHYSIRSSGWRSVFESASTCVVLRIFLLFWQVPLWPFLFSYSHRTETRVCHGSDLVRCSIRQSVW
jgi:hypothetical protein